MCVRNIFDARFKHNHRIDLVGSGLHTFDSMENEAAALHRDKIVFVGVENGERVGACRVALQHKHRRIGFDAERQRKRTQRSGFVERRIVVKSLNCNLFRCRREDIGFFRIAVFGLVERHASHHIAFFVASAVVATAARRQSARRCGKEYRF